MTDAEKLKQAKKIIQMLTKLFWNYEQYDADKVTNTIYEAEDFINKL
jgi:hypothetical protein